MAERTNLQDLLYERQLTKICAPMVRYSKQAFRMLVRKYGCDLAFTPMIMSNSFVQSAQCRENEFVPHANDRPLVAQFAANNAEDFARSAEIVYPHVDGVDLNCGCPQRWAMAEGYGAKLIHRPELVRDVIRQTRNRIPDRDFSVSVKIRIHKDLKETVDMCRKFESAGASFVTVHGRTTSERCQTPHYDFIKAIKDSLTVPVVANGGVKHPDDVYRVEQLTGANGVMVAQGILNNPAVFDGYERTPVRCIEDWLALSEEFQIQLMHFHNHLIYMQKTLPKHEKRIFNNLKLKGEIVKYLNDYYEL